MSKKHRSKSLPLFTIELTRHATSTAAIQILANNRTEAKRKAKELVPVLCWRPVDTQVEIDSAR